MKLYKTFVAVDDFIGTGGQLDKFCKWFDEAVKKQSDSEAVLNVCFVAAMEATRDHTYPTILKELYATSWLAKGITDSYQELT